MIRLRPIGDNDVGRVAAFLHERMERPWSVERWRRTLDCPWAAEGPNRGFMLLDGERVVGAYFAYYSRRQVDGASERICNLGTWCVDPDHRSQAIRLLRALIRQDGHHFTDLTPNETVRALNARLGFEPLDHESAVVPCLPWPRLPGDGSATSEPAAVEAGLRGEDLRLFRDHRAAAGCRHVLLAKGDERCYVVMRRDLRRRIPVCTILYVARPRIFARLTRTFARHLLLRHRALAFVLDDSISPLPPRLSWRRRVSRRMYRSPTLRPDQLDYLYSELACLP